MLDHFSVDELLQSLAKGIHPQYPDNDGSFRGRKGLRRPIHKLSQVIEERRFEVVFLKGLGSQLRCEKAGSEHHGQQTLQYPTSNGEPRTRLKPMTRLALDVEFTALDGYQKLHETLP